jgi:hypothetical protein
LVETVITEELKRLMKKEFGPQVYHIESWWLSKFAEAIDDPNPRWKEVAPPTFPTALMLSELDNAVMETNCPLTRGLNGGNELEYLQPIRLGDTITVTGGVIDMREREGKMGKMLIILSEVSYTNQRGEVAAKCRNTQIRY